MAAELVTLAEFKLHLPATVSDGDEALRQFLVGAVATAEKLCQRKFREGAYTEYYSGSGQMDLLLRQLPVVLVSGVYVDATGYYGDNPDGAFAAETAMVFGKDYVLKRDNGQFSEEGVLRRISSGQGGGGWNSPGTGYGTGSLASPYGRPTWPWGDGNIKVVYSAGYSDVNVGSHVSAPVPTDLKLAIMQLAAQIRLGAPFGGRAIPGAEHLGEYGYNLLQMGGTDPESALGGVWSALQPYVRRTL